MARPGLTRETRHYLIDTSVTPHAVIDLTQFIGAHETNSNTQPSEIAVEQSTTIESYAEGIQTTHGARPLYAGEAGSAPALMKALEHKFDKLYLAVIYDQGNFYLGEASIGTSRDIPTQGFVTQNTDFGQVSPWLAHHKGAYRHKAALNANTDKEFPEIQSQFGIDPTEAYLLVTNITGVNAAASLTVYDGAVAKSAATDDIRSLGLHKLSLAANVPNWSGADRFQIDATTPDTVEFYLLFGIEAD